MTSGKIAAQVSHAAIEVYKKSLNRNKLEVYLWENFFYSTKIVLGVNSEYELVKICKLTKELKLVSYKVRDAGRTEVEPNTITVCGIGPDKSSKIDVLTSNLKLL